MLTPEFEHAMSELLALADNSRTAYMCAERLYFRCHRMLVSDWLVAHGTKSCTSMPRARSNRIS